MHTSDSQAIPLASLGPRRCYSFFPCLRTFLSFTQPCCSPPLTRRLGPYWRVWTVFNVQMTDFCLLPPCLHVFVWLADRSNSGQSVQAIGDRATQAYWSLMSVGSFPPITRCGKVAQETGTQLLVLSILNFWNSNHRKPVIKSYRHYQYFHIKS